ncbi:MAG: alpha-amylase family glycosyl hydrolase [Neobacillus sp.]
MKKKLILNVVFFTILLSIVPTYANAQKEDRLWQDETIYSLMIDRFNNANTKNDYFVNTQDPLAYNGGDLQGVIDKMDYIKDMGFTTIRLTSIFENTERGYHGYWVKDFYKTEEHFGSLETFKKLVKEAHARDLRIIIDFVTNNVSSEHPWIADPSKEDWFHEKREISDWSNQQQVETGWFNSLPDLNHEHTEVKDYLIEAAKWWIENTDIDGYTLPEVNHVPISFWTEFSEEIKLEKKDFILIGVPSTTPNLQKENYLSAGIDGMYDYASANLLREVFGSNNQSLNTKFETHDSQLRINFFDNEKTTRFTSNIVENKHFPGARWKTALTFLYTSPGIPVVFYGSEIALNGEEIPDNHRLMNFRTEKELMDFITKLGELRNQLLSLTRGDIEMIYDKNGMMVFKRSYENETAIIAINNSSESQNVTLSSEQIAPEKELRGLLKGDLVRNIDGEYPIIIDRDEAEIYVIAEKSGINLSLIGALAAVYLLFMWFLITVLRRRKRSNIS